MKKNQAVFKASNYLFTLLLLALVGIGAWFSYHYTTSYDATYGSRNTLSEPTQTLLKSLKEPLEFIAYVPDDADLHQQIRDLVAKYQQFNDEVSVEIINPDLDPERAKADGVQEQSQVILKLGKQSEALSSVTEQSIVNAIQRLQRKDNRLIIFLEGHKEAGLFDTGSSGFSDVAKELQRKGFKLQPHTLLSTKSIPSNTSFVVIAAPKQNYLPEEVNILNKYLADGGNLLWLTEPNQKAGLEALEKTLTLNIPEGRLLSVDDKSFIDVNSPTIIPITRYGDSELMAQQQGQTLFSYATLVQRDLSVKAIWDFDAILTSSNKVWLETNATELSKNIQYDQDSDDIAGPVNLGIALSRSAKNKESKQQRVVVIGDSNFMSNGFIGYGGNLEFTERLFNWLSANENLLVIKAKVAPDTKIEMPDWQLYSLAIFFLFILPIGLLVYGLYRWLARKKA